VIANKDVRLKYPEIRVFAARRRQIREVTSRLTALRKVISRAQLTSSICM
jgi:hypothetical protein